MKPKDARGVSLCSLKKFFTAAFTADLHIDGFLEKAHIGIPGNSANRIQLVRKPANPEIQPYDVTAFQSEIDLTSLEVIRWAPVLMTRAEKLLLYALVFGLRPTRYLEIGTFKGGSALVVSAAMNASNSSGRLSCIDPSPQIDPKHWSIIEHRTTLLTGRSPDILPRACENAGALFDFVLIDGGHAPKEVMQDAEGVLPFVSDDAHLLFHDSYNFDVALGISDFLTQHSDRVVNLGILTREMILEQGPDSVPIRWGGLRLMQIRNHSLEKDRT